MIYCKTFLPIAATNLYFSVVCGYHSPLALSHTTYCSRFTCNISISGQERNLRVPKMVQGDFALAIYCLNKEGVTSLQVVLTIVSLTYPQISYCPLLAPLARLAGCFCCAIHQFYDLLGNLQFNCGKFLLFPSQA